TYDYRYEHAPVTLALQQNQTANCRRAVIDRGEHKNAGKNLLLPSAYSESCVSSANSRLKRRLARAHRGNAVILTDNETRVDLLNNEAISKTIIELLREKPERAVTVGVHGDWGAGKSSILEMIESGLSSDEDVLCIKFNGWRFQGFEDAKIALIEGIVTGLIEKRPLLT